MHFADDTIGVLKDEHQMARFNYHIKTFCDATNMLENPSKREILPVGSFKEKPSIDFAGAQCIWSPDKNIFTNPGWVEKGEYLISLGQPLGNDPTW